MVYQSHFHSHVSFGIELYGAKSTKNLQNILQLQKRAIWIVLNLQQYDSEETAILNSLNNL